MEDEKGKVFLEKENTYTTTQTGSGINTSTACQSTLLSMEESRTYDPVDGDYLETAKEYTIFFASSIKESPSLSLYARKNFSSSESEILKRLPEYIYWITGR